jgi:hypothetical protein
MEQYKKRTVFDIIVKYLELPEIIAIHGARQGVLVADQCLVGAFGHDFFFDHFADS